MLYPTVSKSETSDVLYRYSELHKTIKNNVINLYKKNENNISRMLNKKLRTSGTIAGCVIPQLSMPPNPQ